MIHDEDDATKHYASRGFANDRDALVIEVLCDNTIENKTMELPKEGEPVDMICIRCGASNNEWASRCSECKSPLDDFASTTPWEMGSTTSAAYSSVTSPRKKPIIFWGVWAYFGPSAIGAIWYIGSFVASFFGSESPVVDDEPVLMGGSIMVLILMVMYGALSTWALWSVSKGYFKRR